MKLTTAVIVTKGACFVTDGFTAPIIVGLAQWANTGEWPSNIVWIIIGAMALKGAASQLLSFLSSSYSDYVQTNRIGSSGPSPTAVAAAKLTGP